MGTLPVSKQQRIERAGKKVCNKTARIVQGKSMLENADPLLSAANFKRDF